MARKTLTGFGIGLVTRVTELIARVQAVTRRAQGLSVTEEERPFNAGRLSVDFARNKVLVGGKPVKLTSTERKLLYHLMKNEGLVLSHEALLAKVWGDKYIDSRDLLRVHIQHLRHKLEDDSESPNVIVTEHGMGYKFVKPAGAEMLKSKAMETREKAIDVAEHVKDFATETADKVKDAASEASRKGQAAVKALKS